MDAAKFKTPSASGPVDAGGQGVQWLIGRVIKLLPMANPYKWNENFKKQYGTVGVKYIPGKLRAAEPEESFHSEQRHIDAAWALGQGDPEILDMSLRGTLDT